MSESEIHPAYPLYHNAVDAHVLGAPEEVEEVDPAESQGEHQEAHILPSPAGVQHCWEQQERCLQ